MVTTTTTPFGSVGAVESSFLQNARRGSFVGSTRRDGLITRIITPYFQLCTRETRVVLARGLRREVYRPLLRHRRTSRLRSSAASDGGRPNGPSEIDDRGEKFSDERGEKLLDDLGVCPVPRAEK